MRNPLWWLLVLVGALGALLVLNGRVVGEAPAATSTLPPRAYLPLVLRNFCSGPDCPPTSTPTPTPIAGQVTTGETVVWDEGWGWTFVGLVSNGTTANVSAVRVAVDLKDSGGRTVETVVADVPAWRIQTQDWVCWRTTTFATWVTYTVRVADYQVSNATWPDVRVLSVSLSDGGWPTVSGQIGNFGPGSAYDPQITAWLRSDGRLADCVSAILSPIPTGQTANFTLYASRNLTGTVTLGGTHASGRGQTP
ncbi:MAG: hypothetical protein ACP5N6_07600 [Anaerolineae bacterium]